MLGRSFIIKYVLLTLVLLIASPIRATRHYGFKTLSSDDGLSASYVKAIAQDSNGFIWIGTKSGLDRYDGVSIRAFQCRDEATGRSNTNIGAIYEDTDRNLWIGTDRGVYLYNPHTETFRVIDIESRNGVKPEDWVQTITGDSDGNVWILIPNQGVFKYKKGEIEYYSVTNHNGDKDKLPLSLLTTKKGNVYVGTSRQGIYFYDRQTNDFRRMNGSDNSFNTLGSVMVSFLDELPDETLCFATLRGDLYHVNPITGILTPISFSKGGNVYVRSINCVDNEVWLGTTEGIYTVALNGGLEREISQNTMGRRSLSDNTITSFLVDRDNNMWVGTMFGGITLIQRSGMVVEKYAADITERGLSSNHIRGMAADANGNIWIGTEECGLNILDTISGKIMQLPVSAFENSITLCIESIDDKIYAGFNRGSCRVFKDGRYVETLGTGLIESGNDVYSIFQDNTGNLWIGATWGLFRKDKGSSEFTQISDVGFDWIFNMLQDKKGTIWIASMGDGVWAYYPATNTYRHYAYDETHSNGLRSNSISSILEDSKGRLWFSTDRGGLAQYDPSTDSFISYGIENGLPDDTVYDILEDDLGFLWFGTNRGLVKFNPDTNEIKVFGKPFSQFSYNSAVKAPDGRFYMGGIDGLYVFNPEADADAHRNVPIYFTGFKINGIDGDRSLKANGLTESILFTDRIELSPDNGNFSLSIGSPIYTSYSNDAFVYRLLPVNDEWSVVADPSNLSFAGISPGKYTLEVKRMSDLSAEPRRLAIAVLAPWYQSWWSISIYALLLIGLIVLGAVAYRRRQLHKLSERQNMFTIEKEKELYKKKLQFFTEIAHEIRTPLTLIGTPLEAIEEIGVKDSRIQRYLKVIRQNTSRLLDLTAQVLDFQKMDSDTHELKFETIDIAALLREIIDRFEMTISTRSKALVCRLPDHPILAYIDKDAVTKILSNLINNALKYSDTRIEISLVASDDNIIVDVKSDGEKIAGENRYKIFEPFYQASGKPDSGGVGIGLPLCRTLAHLHGGSIELLDDAVPGYNTFRLSLPVKPEIDEPVLDTNPVIAEYVMEEDSPMTSNNSSYSLLFVDDNDEMREFLYDQLSKDFVTETAANGKEALEKIKENQFDIVVTDIMMPEMDGYELCKAIKDDPNLSPIPVVFLTAKNDLESKVRALEYGGESFIEKPFSIKYFRQQIISLLDNRRHERKAFLNKPFFSVDNMKMNKGDEEFMSKVVSIINENIANESFNVETMADIICMSRSNLLRKIKTLFNLSPIELIRIVRLKKAAELIQEGKYRIGDICFMVGINSQSYFTRLFYKQFGITPKVFEKQCREKSQTGDSPPILPDIELGIPSTDNQ